MRSLAQTAWRDAFSIVIRRTGKSIFFKRDAMLEAVWNIIMEHKYLFVPAMRMGSMFFLSKTRKKKIEDYFKKKIKSGKSQIRLFNESGSYRISCSFNINNTSEAYSLKAYGIKIRIGTVRNSEIHEISILQNDVIEAGTDTEFTAVFYVHPVWSDILKEVENHSVPLKMQVWIFYMNQFKENDVLLFTDLDPSFTAASA